MQEQAKLIIAEQFDSKKIEFIVFSNQIVGEGGFGVVKKAIRNDKPQEQLVVKIIPYEDDKKRDKIEKEISILRKLPQHPNLVFVEPLKCYSNNNYYIFMEFCSDGTLEDLRKKKNNCFTEEQIFNIFYQLMSGYKVLWDNKILHQDLKPANILIKNGLFKLADFGFSIFYEGYKHGSVREGTLPYMPVQKMTQKDYYATAKSDIYAMGILLFQLITGHHPYVQSKNKQFRSYLRELKANSLFLRPNFSSRFSIKFQHFFDLVLKMIAKSESARINFDVIYDYIDNQEIFDEIKKKVNKLDKQVIKAIYNKFYITAQSEAIAINFCVPQGEDKKIEEQIQANSKSKKTQEEEKSRRQLESYLVSHRIIVYFFDRLTRRIYIDKLKKKNLTQNQMAFMEKVILSLLLLCKKIIQVILKESKTGTNYPIASWKSFRKENLPLLKLIQKDETYLQDLVIDCLSESSQTKIIEKKDILDKSKLELNTFINLVRYLLQSFYETKKSALKIEDRQNLITICYIRSGIQILSEFENWENNAVELQVYFRQIQTEDSAALLSKVTNSFLDKGIEPVFVCEEDEDLDEPELI